MIFDGLILIITSVLCLNGWKRGILRSWRGPIAMVASTLIVQKFYVDFAAWLACRLRIGPETAVLVGYLILWFSLETILEIALSTLIKYDVKGTPVFFDRVGGVFYGLCKTAVIVILPLMATSVELNIPEPPVDKSGLKLPDLSGSVKQSYLVPGFRSVAESLLPICGGNVVSTSAPSFSPSYGSPKSGDGTEGEDQNTKGVESRRDALQQLLK